VLIGSQISYRSRSNSWPVLAVDPKSYAQTFTTPRSMIAGAFLDPGATNEIVLGIGIAGAGRSQQSTYGSSLQTVNVGDKVTVTLRGGDNHVFTVRGIYETDLAQANTTAFISTATATKLIPQLAGVSSSIYVKTRQIGNEQGIIDELRHQRPEVRYQTWQALASSLADVTGSFGSIKSILNAVSLFVAAISVFIVTYVDLVNKRRTMGVERAIGISGPAIIASYGLKAVAFAVLGIAFGAGLFFGGAMPLVNRYPFQFPIGPVTLSVTQQELQRDAIILIVVAVVGALVPAWRAVRVHLLKAIWG
jgi:putative ABC transport system permease protein